MTFGDLLLDSGVAGDGTATAESKAGVLSRSRLPSRRLPPPPDHPAWCCPLLITTLMVELPGLFDPKS